MERVACIPPSRPGEEPRSILEALRGTPCRIVELRLDLLGWSPREAREAVELLSSSGYRVIATLRDASEGGKYRGPPEEKLSLLFSLADAGAEFVDFEYRFPLLDDALSDLPGRIIVSAHYMGYTPAPEILYAAAGDMLRRGARVAKLVGYARRLSDNWRLLGVNVKWPGRVAAFAMGPVGRLSRVLAPLMGAALVYAPLGEAVAPGQLGLRELLEAWRLLLGLDEVRDLDRLVN